MKILEYAASFENVLHISLTCRRWNYILNKNEVTCEHIWLRITKQVYDPREFEELERIFPQNSYCNGNSCLHYRRVSVEGVSWNNGENNSKAFLGSSEPAHSFVLLSVLDIGLC